MFSCRRFVSVIVTMIASLKRTAGFQRFSTFGPGFRSNLLFNQRHQAWAVKLSIARCNPPLWRSTARSSSDSTYTEHKSVSALSSSSSTSTEDTSPSSLSSSSSSSKEEAALAAESLDTTPWNDPRIQERTWKQRQNNKSRFRQHVNPLASQYQKPTLLSEKWPADVFNDCAKPLHLDIGCGKGGFLLDLVAATKSKENEESVSDEPKNYLGLEIRPMVAQYAKERVGIHGHAGRLEFLGCNANVDLDRILTRYQAAFEQATATASASHGATQNIRNLCLSIVTIQYPDPHFKARHAKRRVVRAEIVETLAKFLPTDGIVFLQSDIQPVLDDMREQFRSFPLYFTDSLESENDYVDENILGVPTEREVSVLEKDLPVYRSVFTRTSTPYDSDHSSSTAMTQETVE